MPLISIPKELIGVKMIKDIDLDTGIGEIRLPNDATPEQIKAYREYQNRCKKAQHDMIIIEE